MDQQIRRLVDDMLHPNAAGATVAESVSGRAYAFVEAAADPGLLQAAKEGVFAEKNKLRRQTLYFIIRKLGWSLKDQETVHFLIRQLRRESDKMVLMFLLDGIAGLAKPKETDLSPIFALVGDERWQVRYSALEALKKTENSQAEEVLIGVLKKSSDPRDLLYAISTLYDIGTPRAIVAIEPHLGSRKRDLKIAARSAIDEIRKRATIVG